MKMWWDNLPNPTLIETAWERQMNLSGLEAYETARTGTDPSSTRAGQKTIRKLLTIAEEAITQLQRELISTAVDRSLKATILIVPADTTAMLTLKPILDRTYTAANPDLGIGYQSVITEVAKSVELELNFRHWVQSSKEAAEAYAKAEGLAKVPKSYAERLIMEQGCDARTLRRWKNTFSELQEYEWDTRERHYCGDALVTAVVNALPEHFETHHYLAKGKNQKFVKMTDTFRRTFDDMESHIASMQMVKKPMITKPKRWIEVTE